MAGLPKLRIQYSLTPINGLGPDPHISSYDAKEAVLLCFELVINIPWSFNVFPKEAIVSTTSHLIRISIPSQNLMY